MTKCSFVFTEYKSAIASSKFEKPPNLEVWIPGSQEILKQLRFYVFSVCNAETYTVGVSCLTLEKLSFTWCKPFSANYKAVPRYMHLFCEQIYCVIPSQVRIWISSTKEMAQPHLI